METSLRFAEYYLQYAEEEFGKDNPYTRAIAELYDICKNSSSISGDSLELAVEALYWEGRVKEAVKEEEEDFEEQDDLEMGFNPYIGGYDFDC